MKKSLLFSLCILTDLRMTINSQGCLVKWNLRSFILPCWNAIKHNVINSPEQSIRRGSELFCTQCLYHRAYWDGWGFLFFFFLRSAVLTCPRFAVQWIYDPVKVMQNKTSLDATWKGSMINRFLRRAVHRQPRYRVLVFKKAWGGGGMPWEK